MKKNRIRKRCLLAVICMTVAVSCFPAQTVYAYEYARTGADKDGTVTIQAVPAGNSANGYIIPTGYQVSYVVKKNAWTAFDRSNGCDFYIGNNLNVSGGCHFVYKPNGNIWDAGALNLGSISDGRVVGSAEPNSEGTVQVSFQVQTLSELPAYICYTYQPAGGAYVHMSESYGHNYHVWCYQNLNNVTPANSSAIDESAPSLSVEVAAGGTTATVNGKIWGSGAVIKATAADDRSRPGGIRFYKNGAQVYTCNNASNAVSLFGQYAVNANGSYQVNTYDQLGNTSGTKTVTVDCIDTELPTLSAMNMSIGEEVTVEGKVWSRKKKIHIEASDEKSGLKKIVITDADGKEILTKLPENAGCKELSFETEALLSGIYSITAYDNLGNTDKKTKVIDRVDDTPPVITGVSQTVLDNGKVRITVEATDNEDGSGLAVEAYSFDGGITWQKDNYIDVEKNDTYEIAVRDQMGLQEKKDETVTAIRSKNDSDGKNTSDKKDESDRQNDTNRQNTSDEQNDNNKKDDYGKQDQTNPQGNGQDINSTDPSVSSPGSMPTGTDNGDKKKTNSFLKRKSKNNNSVSDNSVSQSDRLNNPEKKRRENKVTKAIERVIDESLKNRENEVKRIEDKEVKAEKKVKRIAAIVLAAVLITGLVALGAYFLLTALYYSCILYAIDDGNNKKRLCILPIKTASDDWLVEVPDHKLGTFGNGRYLLVFRTSFVKEGDSDYVVITIDKNRIREKLREEIEIKI